MQEWGSPVWASNRSRKSHSEAHPCRASFLPVNIGISTNKLLAKMAGELEKPNKCITLFPEEIETKFWPLPIEDLFMVGRRTAPRLRKMGIRTVGELAAYPPLLLERIQKLWQAASRLCKWDR